MSLANLQLAFELIASNSDLADFSGPQTVERISRAEQLLGIEFPATYREFLLRLGCGDIAGEEFYGIANKDLEAPGVPNALWMTISRRQKAGLSPTCLVVCATGLGSEYIIETSLQNADGDCPVLLWRPGATDVSRIKVANDFGDFLFTMVSEAIESWRREAEFDE